MYNFKQPNGKWVLDYGKYAKKDDINHHKEIRKISKTTIWTLKSIHYYYDLLL